MESKPVLPVYGTPSKKSVYVRPKTYTAMDPAPETVTPPLPPRSSVKIENNAPTRSLPVPPTRPNQPQ